MSKETPTPKQTEPEKYSAYAVTAYNIHDQSRADLKPGESGKNAATQEEAIESLKKELGPEYDGLEIISVPITRVYLRGRFLE